MKKSVSPAAAAVAIILVIAIVGALLMKFTGSTGAGSSDQVTVKAPDKNDPHFKADPKLAGGGG